MTGTTLAPQSPAPQATLGDLVGVLRNLMDEELTASMKIAVPIHEATRMLGMKDDEFTRNLIRLGRLRTRKERGSKTTLVSVKSIRQYMGDLPKGR